MSNEEAIDVKNDRFVYLIKMSCAIFSGATIGAYLSKEEALSFLDSVHYFGPFPDTTKFRIETMILNKPLYPIKTVVTTAKLESPAIRAETTSWKDQGMS